MPSHPEPLSLPALGGLDAVGAVTGPDEAPAPCPGDPALAPDAGIDAAMASISGGTSQPNLNTLVESLRNTPRESSLDGAVLDAISEYWREAREFYTPFESPVLAAGSDLYQHEMPGGQYTNLFQQATAL